MFSSFGICNDYRGIRFYDLLWERLNQSVLHFFSVGHIIYHIFDRPHELAHTRRRMKGVKWERYTKSTTNHAPCSLVTGAIHRTIVHWTLHYALSGILVIHRSPATQSCIYPKRRRGELYKLNFDFIVCRFGWQLRNTTTVEKKKNNQYPHRMKNNASDQSQWPLTPTAHHMTPISLPH